MSDHVFAEDGPFMAIVGDERMWMWAQSMEQALWAWQTAGKEGIDFARCMTGICWEAELPHMKSESDRDRLHRMSYTEFLASPEWRATRELVIRLADFRCRTCDSPDNLEVHHRTYERRGHEDPGDLIALCAACHTAVHLVADGRRGKVRKTSRRARV